MDNAAAPAPAPAPSAPGTQDEPLAFLRRLYESLQVLNRKLVTASASGTLEAVHGIHELLSASTDFKVEQLAPEQLSEARDLVRRIAHLQDLNRSVCNGGLKSIRTFAEAIGKPSSYDECGKIKDALLQDLNISA